MSPWLRVHAQGARGGQAVRDRPRLRPQQRAGGCREHGQHLRHVRFRWADVCRAALPVVDAVGGPHGQARGVVQLRRLPRRRGRREAREGVRQGGCGAAHVCAGVPEHPGRRAYQRTHCGSDGCRVAPQRRRLVRHVSAGRLRASVGRHREEDTRGSRRSPHAASAERAGLAGRGDCRGVVRGAVARGQGGRHHPHRRHVRGGPAPVEVSAVLHPP